MTTPSEEEARVLIERLSAVQADSYLSATYLGNEHVGDLIRDVISALASRVSTPPSEDWEYGVGWEYQGRTYGYKVESLESAQKDVTEHPADEGGRPYYVVQRHSERPAGPWEPVPAVPEPGGCSAHGDRNCREDICQDEWNPETGSYSIRPAVPVLPGEPVEAYSFADSIAPPTEPEGGSFQPLGGGFYRVAGAARDAMTGRYKTGSTEPEGKR